MLEPRARGGRRPGAGRPPNGLRAGVSHLRRPSLSAAHPLHVTLRVVPGVRSLRGSSLFRVIRRALAAASCRFGFRLVHFSVQRNHLHLLVEARDRLALRRGAQGLAIRVARAVNRRLQRRGKLFGDRYHARALLTARAARFALRYVLANVRKHAAAQLPAGHIDDCSSAAWFDGWARPAELAFGARRGADPPVMRARTWLLRVGWRRAGPLDVDDAPAR